MKEKIVELLMSELSYAYCDNCNNDDSMFCDGCHRKYQNWCLSEAVAYDLSDRIIGILNANEKEKA